VDRLSRAGVAWGQIVGVCSFKDKCRDGIVEIAYFTFTHAEGRGFGGRMARALIAIAWAEPEVTAIRAHTMPEDNASGRILRRLGFERTGAIEDPEDGTVWRWEMDRPNSGGLAGAE
jgi:ribosomal-protein-alanine N-acetyltransferase